jgi:isoquinoline 1-oxidoreductase beta subunit
MRAKPSGKGTRRSFLRHTATAGASLTFVLQVPELMNAAPSRAFEPNAYIRITPDNTITFWITRSEMGQGVRTLLTTVLAEELETDPDRVKLEQAMPGERFKGVRLRTSGSGSSSGTFRALRVAGACAREMLISAAAQVWKVEASTCRAEMGSVIHSPSSRRLRYGDLTDIAARQPLPANPPLKPAATFRLIGKPAKRIDAPEIVRGQAHYGIDVRVPGMLVAVIARCPYLAGKAMSSDSIRARAVPGVRHVVPVHSGIFGGIAVVADHTWAAMKGRDALNVQWDHGPNSDFDSSRFIEALKASFVQEGYPIRREGDWQSAMSGATSRLEAVYEYPFQAHAPLETMNCVADVRRDSCEVWAPTQTPETAQQSIVKSLGLPAEAVRIHTTLLGGGFGRRLIVDYVDEAVEISQAVGKPVQVVWSREDDMQNGFFHPASVERMSAGLAEGRVVTWMHKSIGSDMSMVGVPTAEEKKDPQAYANNEFPWGAFDTFYNFRSLKVDYVPVDSPVPTGAWRAVMYPSRVFGRESFLDEVAHTLRQDPFELRINLLQPGGVVKIGPQEIDRGRMVRVLEEARERSGWTRPLAIPGSGDRLTGRGLAINIYAAESYMAQVAEISVARDLTDFRVHRMVCVFDCGRPLNPAGLEGQVESAIAWGLSAALHGKINFRNGRAVESGYHDFRVMRMDEMPLIETHILPSTAAFGGFGEHPVAPAAPAVANALFAATGRRIRRLPITAADLRV